MVYFLFQEIQNGLEEFSIKFHLFANVVCDRGINIIKALETSNIEPVHCLAHRLNNMLNRCFLSNSERKKSNQQTTTQLVHEQNLFLSSDDENSCHSSDDENIPVKNYANVSKIRKQKRENIKTTRYPIDNFDVNCNEVKHLHDLPAEALSIIQTIKYIKSIVTYVKKVSNSIF